MIVTIKTTFESHGHPHDNSTRFCCKASIAHTTKTYAPVQLVLTCCYYTRILNLVKPARRQVLLGQSDAYGFPGLFILRYQAQQGLFPAVSLAKRTARRGIPRDHQIYAAYSSFIEPPCPKYHV